MAHILILKKIVHFSSRRKKYADTGYAYAAMSLHFENANGERKHIHNAGSYRDAMISAREYQKFTELPLKFETIEVLD